MEFVGGLLYDVLEVLLIYLHRCCCVWKLIFARLMGVFPSLAFLSPRHFRSLYYGWLMMSRMFGLARMVEI